MLVLCRRRSGGGWTSICQFLMIYTQNIIFNKTIIIHILNHKLSEINTDISIIPGNEKISLLKPLPNIRSYSNKSFTLGILYYKNILNAT